MSWRLKNGEKVIERKNSHLHKGVLEKISEALFQIESRNRDFLVEEIQFEEVIGETICVETFKKDRFIYSKRIGREGHSKFVFRANPEPCRYMTVILKKVAEGYVLISAFISRKLQPEPWDLKHFLQQKNPREAQIKSWHFWEKHALVWGMEKVDPKTKTFKCPWVFCCEEIQQLECCKTGNKVFALQV